MKSLLLGTALVLSLAAPAFAGGYVSPGETSALGLDLAGAVSGGNTQTTTTSSTNIAGNFNANNSVSGVFDSGNSSAMSVSVVMGVGNGDGGSATDNVISAAGATGGTTGSNNKHGH
jgi:hypothetical protein